MFSFDAAVVWKASVGASMVESKYIYIYSYDVEFHIENITTYNFFLFRLTTDLTKKKVKNRSRLVFRLYAKLTVKLDCY